MEAGHTRRVAPDVLEQVARSAAVDNLDFAYNRSFVPCACQIESDSCYEPAAAVVADENRAPEEAA